LAYHRARIEKAVEDNKAFLQVEEEILALEREIAAAEAILKAYEISPREARTCRW